MLAALLCACMPVFGAEPGPFDAAAAFGARASVAAMRLSPDGKSVAYLAPAKGQGSTLFTLSLADGAKPKPALAVTGKGESLSDCFWVANDRLACRISANLKDPTFGILPTNRLMAVNADGSNVKLLSKADSVHGHGLALGGGDIIDSLPTEDGVVLMVRPYVAEDRLGSHLGSAAHGLGVDRVNTRTLDSRRAEAPRPDAEEYISDGRGNVRILGLSVAATANTTDQDSGITDYLYRAPGSQDWHKLSEYNSLERTGFDPYAVDPDHNVAIGLKKTDGRYAVYSVSLDNALNEQLLYANPDVDVDGLISIGREARVVGASYDTDRRHAVYFDPGVKQLLSSLGRALPQQPIVEVVDSSADENTMLVFAGSDSDPGVYYLFDKKAHRLQTFLVARNELEGVKLASVKPIAYPSSDGVMVPAYLTLPPGATSPKGLPAIVLPHGGPSARDYWGFDWLSQFYASRGFVVLQPEFRGSFGYGDAWFRENGFKSWRVSIGDVVAAGHWLIDQGVDPRKLGILGWSYGGYAALQSAVVEPGLFKAVVAIAPVTDFAAAKQEWRHSAGYYYVSTMIGDGPHVREGSPLQNAEKIKAPVLLFHAALDRNVSIEQSRSMADRMKAVGGRCELVTWDDLDHQLDDSEARTLMLRRSEAFLRQGFGM
jgi:dipeptidyl aminopeptidase/acylaminoacyl peptidase